MSETLSVLPELEPSLAIAFALNLAYIGLERFRYRKEIREFASLKAESLKDAPDNIREMRCYKSLARLSCLEDHGRKWYCLPHKDEKLSGIWGWIYCFWFECHIDRFFVILSAVFCAVLLTLGVAHKVDVLPSTQCLFSAELISYSFYFSVLMTLLPVVSVLSGKHAVKSAKQFAEEQLRELSLALQVRGPQSVSVDD